MKPIRVLQVLTIMNRGGAETMVMNYYRHIDRTKVQFDFLLHREERGVFEDEIESLGGKIYKLQPINLSNLPSYIKSLDSFFIEHPEYKIVHSHLNALSVFIMRSAKKHQVPVRIAHSHTSLYHLNLNPFSKDRHSLGFAFRFFAQNFFKLRVPKYANHFFSCGDKAGRWLFGKKNLDKVKIINNAIDTDIFVYNQEVSNRLKQSLRVENKLVIGHVGNFVFEKNHPFILRIFEEVKKKEKKAVLVLVGAGNRVHIEGLAKNLEIFDDILFLGVRKDVPDLMQAMDIFLFPSTNEGLPVTLIEAQAAGLKIIASDGVSSESNIIGMVQFESLLKSPEEWANLLLRSIDYMRTNTKQRIVQSQYDIKSNALSLQNFYSNQLK